GRLPFMRFDHMLRRMASMHIGPEQYVAHRAGVVLRQREAQRVAGMEQPDLRRIDPVPVRTLAGLEQKMDCCADGAPVWPLRPAPCLAVPSAFGMRLQVQSFDDRACAAHGSLMHCAAWPCHRSEG